MVRVEYVLERSTDWEDEYWVHFSGSDYQIRIEKSSNMTLKQVVAEGLGLEDFELVPRGGE